MSKKILRQTAAENPYLHKDFHIALNYALDYLHKKFGEGAVREYLTQFANSYYSPLKKAIKNKGLLAIKEHYEKIFEMESARFDIIFSQDELFLHLLASPAVIHIKANGHPVSQIFGESVTIVFKIICQDTPYDVEMLEYHQENGAYRIRFFKRPE